jgi:hypothetical protein
MFPLKTAVRQIEEQNSHQGAAKIESGGAVLRWKDVRDEGQGWAKVEAAQQQRETAHRWA